MDGPVCPEFIFVVQCVLKFVIGSLCPEACGVLSPEFQYLVHCNLKFRFCGSVCSEFRFFGPVSLEFRFRFLAQCVLNVGFSQEFCHTHTL